MTVSVVVPWRPGCPWRENTLAHLLPRWEDTGWQVIVAAQPDGGPWCKAAAVAAGLADATGDVLVVADADVWCDGVTSAVRAVQQGAPWAIPHLMVHRLTPQVTRDVLNGTPLSPDLPLHQDPYPGYPGGGLTVLPRTTYDQIPLDPRYKGWGQEDESWATALHTLAGQPWRGTAPLYHLYHPPQPRQSRRWGSPEARALYFRYRHAAHTPALMRALLDEALTPYGGPP